MFNSFYNTESANFFVNKILVYMYFNAIVGKNLFSSKRGGGGGGDAYLRGRQGNFDLGKMMVSILHTN